MFTEQTSEHGEIASEKAVIGTKVPRWDGAGLVARWWPFRSILARAQRGFCWTALANSEQRNSGPGIDKMARNMVRSVKGWVA
jgi:hypothetical protein